MGKPLTQGLAPALLQGPLSRFGDTAANAGVLALLDGDDRTRSLPTGVKSLASATVATAWRVGLMPLDTFKTILQVEGAKGAATYIFRPLVRDGGQKVTAGRSLYDTLQYSHTRTLQNEPEAWLR